MTATQDLLKKVTSADQDYEWYPTTRQMIEAVKRWIPEDADSIMDIGAGDGRVLVELGKKAREYVTLYAIEKSTVLIQAQPDKIVPVGTDFYEQNLACLQVDYIFCNPPYSQFEAWAAKIIESGYAEKAFLIVPRRWKDSKAIQSAIKRRGAHTRIIGSDDFLDADRRSRSVVDIVEVHYPHDSGYRNKPIDPFDIWFDQNISTFDQAEEDVSEYEREYQDAKELAKRHKNSNIAEMVESYLEEYGRLEANYKAIFQLDHAILKELGVSKEDVCEGVKKKMAGLKAKYWQLLFDRLDAITTRLCTETKKRFVEKLTKSTSVTFTANNAYAVVLWAIKNANKYYDEQLVKLFRDLSTFDEVLNYKSNTRTWKKSGWRYQCEDHSHYALDYRFVVCKYSAIFSGEHYGSYGYPGNLSDGCHELIADIVAVMSNLGFASIDIKSTDRQWESGQWQNFHWKDKVLFQVKAHKNGNLHMRFLPDAIKALNVEAGRLLGWIQSADDVVNELGYTAEDAKRFFGSSIRIAPTHIKLLTA